MIASGQGFSLDCNVTRDRCKINVTALEYAFGYSQMSASPDSEQDAYELQLQDMSESEEEVINKYVWFPSSCAHDVILSSLCFDSRAICCLGISKRVRRRSMTCKLAP